jgi:ribosomal protein L7/L12
VKKCPFCAEAIQDEARKCRYCGEWVPDESTDGADANTHRRYDVLLASPGLKRNQVIDEVRELTHLGLKETKELVDGSVYAPALVLTGLDEAAAAKAVSQLTATGAEAKAEEIGGPQFLNVVLVTPGPHRMDTVKAIHRATNATLVLAGEAAANPPAILASGVSPPRAERMREILVGAGCEIVLEPQRGVRPERSGPIARVDEAHGDDVISLVGLEVVACPSCRSVRVRKIGGARKGIGIASKDAPATTAVKTFECLTCKTQW